MADKVSVIGNPIENFKPDLEIKIEVQTSTGNVRISSGNGVPINPLYLASVCSGIVKANVDQLLQAQAQQVTNKGKLPHQFLALEGEHRCRVPGCGKIKNDAIHIAIPPTEETVQ